MATLNDCGIKRAFNVTGRLLCVKKDSMKNCTLSAMKSFTMAAAVCVLINACVVVCSAEEIYMNAPPGLAGVVDIMCSNYIQKNKAVKISRGYAVAGVVAENLEREEKLDIVIMLSGRTSGILIEKNYLDKSSIMTFGTNRLIVVGKAGLKLKSLQDLDSVRYLAIGNPALVATGEYAVHVLNRAGLEKTLRNRLVKTRDNRESLFLVRAGKADAAIVNKSDVQSSGLAFQSIDIPTTLHPRLTYIVALTQQGKKKKNVVEFYRYLCSEEARRVLTKHNLAI